MFLVANECDMTSAHGQDNTVRSRWLAWNFLVHIKFSKCLMCTALDFMQNVPCCFFFITFTQGHNFKVKFTVVLYVIFLSRPCFLCSLFTQFDIWQKKCSLSWFIKSSTKSHISQVKVTVLAWNIYVLSHHIIVQCA